MVIFFVVAPFAAFATLMLVTTSAVSLFGAAAVAAATIAYDLRRGASIKILAAGAMMLFLLLGCYVTFINSSWSNPALRLAVDTGVLTIALLSIAFRFPFTLQYAREMVDGETRKLPGFLHANYVITWVWTAAFLLMVLTNLVMIYHPGLPLWAGLAMALVARNCAVIFTRWYRAGSKAAAASLGPRHAEARSDGA